MQSLYNTHMCAHTQMYTHETWKTNLKSKTFLSSGISDKEHILEYWGNLGKGQAVCQEESRAQEELEESGLSLCVLTRPELPRLSSSDSGLRLPLEWPCKGAEIERL